jgi:hypothetical protein
MLKILTLYWNGINNLKEIEPGLLDVIKNVGDAEWYVRDNGSKDGSVDWLKEKSYIKLLEAGHNRDNFSQGVNSLYKMSNAKHDDLILLLNNDIVFKVNNPDRIFDSGDQSVRVTLESFCKKYGIEESRNIQLHSIKKAAVNSALTITNGNITGISS